MRRGQRPGIYPLEAADVDRAHLGAILGLAARESVNPAVLAEHVVQVLLAELVVLERVLAREQFELRRGDERPHRSDATADGAVALHHLVERHGRFVAHVSAVTASGLLLGLCHVASRCRSHYLMNQRLQKWDEKFSRGEEVHGFAPSAPLPGAIAGLSPGLALDLASGAGRHALFLAEHGWRVRAIDGSQIGIDRTMEEAGGGGGGGFCG